jgi:hypothetical protein
MVLWVWDRKIVTVVAASYHKITGESRQILFEALPSQTQDLHGFSLHWVLLVIHRMSLWCRRIVFGLLVV